MEAPREHGRVIIPESLATNEFPVIFQPSSGEARAAVVWLEFLLPAFSPLREIHLRSTGRSQPITAALVFERTNQRRFYNKQPPPR